MCVMKIQLCLAKLINLQCASNEIDGGYLSSALTTLDFSMNRI